MQQKPPDGASRRRTAFHRWIKSRLEYKPGVRAARYQQVRTEFLSHWPADKDQDQRNKVAAALERGEDGEPPPWDKLFEAEAAVISRLGLEALLVKHGNLGEEFAAVGAPNSPQGILRGWLPRRTWRSSATASSRFEPKHWICWRTFSGSASSVKALA